MMCASGHIGTLGAGDGNGSVLGRRLHSIDLGGSGDDVLLQHLHLGCHRWERRQAAERRPVLGVGNLVMCLPTCDGWLFSLVVDLPNNSQSLHVIVVAAGTPRESPSTS